MSEPENVLDHPLVIRERIGLENRITRLQCWLIVIAGVALLEFIALVV